MQHEHRSAPEQVAPVQPAAEPSLPLSTLRGLVGGILVFGLVGGGLAGAAVATILTNHDLPSGKDHDLSVSQSKAVIVEESSVVDTVQKASESVVSVVAEKPARQATGNYAPFDLNLGIPGFEFFSPQPQQQTPQSQSDTPQREEDYVQAGAGTGFVVSEKGLILTNRHVVSDKDARYSIITKDGERHEVEILGVDPVNDLAVIKTKDDVKLPALELGDSDHIQIGQTVLAIGNSLGEFSNTVTKGVISGIDRRVVASDGLGGAETLEAAIQTDAAINPGNSGGPLLNVMGQVIGMNTAVSREGQLIGFAIPINDAVRFIDNIEKYGHVVRPYLGVRYVIINDQIQKLNNVPVDHGALLRRGDNAQELAVIPGGPADKAGLEENDIILEVDGTEVSESNSLIRILSKHAPGDTIKLKVLKDGKEKMLTVTLGEFKDDSK